MSPSWEPPPIQGDPRKRIDQRHPVLVAVAVVAVILAALAAVHFGSQPSHTVTLSAGSDGGSLGSVTYGPVGTTAQDTAPSDPWSATGRYSTVPGMSMVVQNGGGSGRVWCSIRIDGQVADSETSTGPYAVVTCSS